MAKKKEPRAEPERNLTAGKKQAKRDSKGRFVKGSSGNAGGRTKLPDDLKQAFREASPMALETLKRVLLDEDAKDSDKIRAAEIVLDRAYGKPTQSVNVDTETPQRFVFVGMNDVKD